LITLHHLHIENDPFTDQRKSPKLLLFQSMERKH